MWRNLAIPFLLAGVLIAGGSLRPIFSNQTVPSVNIKPMLDLAKNLAVLHKNTRERIDDLNRKASRAEKALAPNARIGPEQKAEIGEIIGSGDTLPKTLWALDSGMSQLRAMLLARRFIEMDERFTAWDNVFDTTIHDAEAFQDSAADLQQALGAERTRLTGALEDAAGKLFLLNQDLPRLHEQFQVIANLLEILQQAGVQGIPPRKRILGESWLAHEIRTNRWGIADPKHLGRFFNSHAVEAIQDRNSAHVVWADEATIQDYTKGTVKGTEHPYINSSKVSYCLRCHAYRNGECNNRWCNLEYSDELEKDVKIIEQTSNR